MPISCALGLAACLHYYGTKVHVDDAFAVMDTCALIEEIKPRSLEKLSFTADYIVDKTGRQITWPKRASYPVRYAAIRRECAAFRSAFNQDSKWENLDKWPGK